MNFTSKLKSFKIETDRRNFDKKFIFLLILLLLFAFATVAVVVVTAAAATIDVTNAVVVVTQKSNKTAENCLINYNYPSN